MNRNALRRGILVLDAVLGAKDIGCELSKMGDFWSCYWGLPKTER